MDKKQNLLTKFFAKNKSVELTDHETGAIWRSIPNFYSHFTKVPLKCECFGCSVEPCKFDITLAHFEASA
jgi:hypothetical protein